MMTNHLKGRLASLFDEQVNLENYEGSVVTFHKKFPVAKDEIAIAISNDLKVPNDYLDFLHIHDGCTLFNYQDLDGFKFLGIKEILNENTIQPQTYEEKWNDDLTVFCSLLGDGDFLSFKIYGENNYEILDCYHDDDPRNWKVISRSLNDFLERLIDERGKRFWL